MATARRCSFCRGSERTIAPLGRSAAFCRCSATTSSAGASGRTAPKCQTRSKRSAHVSSERRQKPDGRCLWLARAVVAISPAKWDGTIPNQIRRVVREDLVAQDGSRLVTSLRTIVTRAESSSEMKALRRALECVMRSRRPRFYRSISQQLLICPHQLAEGLRSVLYHQGTRLGYASQPEHGLQLREPIGQSRRNQQRRKHRNRCAHLPALHQTLPIPRPRAPPSSPGTAPRIQGVGDAQSSGNG